MLMNHVKHYRTLNNQSQGDLARYLEIDRSMISRYESGKDNPSDSVTLRLAELWKVKTTDILQIKEYVK